MILNDASSRRADLDGAARRDLSFASIAWKLMHARLGRRTVQSLFQPSEIVPQFRARAIEQRIRAQRRAILGR